MLTKSRFLEYTGKKVTLNLPAMSITGTLEEITPDYLVVKTGEGEEAETVFVFLSQVLAMKVGERA